ncbi:MAG: dihydrolipoyl dehydrogenase [Candidatus Bipolaricaulota bacterium]|nr:dihydrolipoyl dehydrogenase [Candidatus Bipolaricaulota bacterium]
METTEVVVIGGGPGGYVAARRLGALGVETVLVERAHLGGTCLNEGCIPTKALYAATAPLGRKEALARMGVALSPEVDLDRMRGWLGEVVAKLRTGIAGLLSSAKVEVLPGEGSLAGPGRVRVRTADGEREIRARAVVLATGSAPIALPGLPFDGERVWSSSDALWLPRIPERLVVVGGGVIGLELATVYRRLGSEVAVVEALDRLLPGVGLSRRGESVLRRSLASQGIEVRLGARAERLTSDGIVIRSGDKEEEVPAEAVLVAVGRRPTPNGLGLETVGVRVERGFVVTDSRFAAAPGVYAIGDLRGGWLLAHKASHEGLLVADGIAAELGRAPRPAETREPAIPQAIFTQPEVGLVGVPVDEAAPRGLKTARFPLAALGRAWAEGEPEGHVQLVADGDGRLLGAEIVGSHASDLVAEAALAIEAGLRAEDLAATVHAHPTFAEGLWEAALSLLGRPLHSA